MKSKRNAFTLMEFLITITIVGIIAALTIPNLMQSISNDKYKSAWKKNYAELKQTAQLMLQDYDSSFTNAFSNSDDMKNKFLKYLSDIRICNSGSALGNCWSNNTFNLSGSTYTFSEAPSVILADGTMMMFNLSSQDCTDTTNSGTLQKCGTIYVDINGMQLPNTWGKDIFGLYVVPKGIKPFGLNYDNIDPNKTCRMNAASDTNNTGFGCASYLLYN